jgi:hypothetical protein
MPAVFLNQGDVLATVLGKKAVGAVLQLSVYSVLLEVSGYIAQHVCGTLWQSTSTRVDSFGWELVQGLRRKADFNVTN